MKKRRIFFNDTFPLSNLFCNYRWGKCFLGQLRKLQLFTFSASGYLLFIQDEKRVVEFRKMQRWANAIPSLWPLLIIRTREFALKGLESGNDSQSGGSGGDFGKFF